MCVLVPQFEFQQSNQQCSTVLLLDQGKMNDYKLQFLPNSKIITPPRVFILVVNKNESIS